MTQQRDTPAPKDAPKGDTVTLDLSGPSAHRVAAAIAAAVADAVGADSVHTSVRRKGCSEAIRQMAVTSFSVVPELNECAALVFRADPGKPMAAAVTAAIAAALADAGDGVHMVKLKVVRGPA